LIMNYEKIYESLCSSRKFRPLRKEIGYEIHHIIPSSMGGSDLSSNLVKLTCREHYLAHWLLYKIHKSSSMAAAWKFMCEGNTKQKAKVSILTSRDYERARKAHSEELKGSIPWNKGKKEDPEITKKRALKLKGRKHSKEHAESISKGLKGVKKSPRKLSHTINNMISRLKNRPELYENMEQVYDLRILDGGKLKYKAFYNKYPDCPKIPEVWFVKIQKGWNPHFCHMYQSFKRSL